MLILARPAISTYLARTLYENRIPAVPTDDAPIPMRPALKLTPPAELEADPKGAYQRLLLTSGENALAYLYRVIPYDDRVLKARLFKDKAAFRRAIAGKFPGYFFREFKEAGLDAVDPSQLRFPLVLKPSVGISSIGVIRVATAADWPAAVAFLRKDLALYRSNYAANVVETESILAEGYIEGREIAVDGYYGRDAEPVVLNLMEHLFKDEKDTSDLMYVTRKSLVKEMLEPVTAFLKTFGDVFDLKRFPFHLELRLTPQGELIPIELNPLRFSGLGTVEIAQYAYGINVYESFFLEKRPDWGAILDREDDSVYSFLCVELPSARFRAKGLVVRDRELFHELGEVLEYRIQDERETSTFAVIFIRSPDLEEPRRLVAADFSRFYGS